MSSSLFTQALGKARLEKQKQLNELFWWVSLVTSTLDSFLSTTGFSEIVKIKVPSGKGYKEVPRTRDKIIEALNLAKDYDIFQSVFIFSVSKVEDFLNQVATIMLLADNRRLKQSISGIEGIKKIDIENIIDMPSKKEIVESIIEKIVIQLFYAGPQKQQEYFKNVLGIEVDDKYWNIWFEIKASRDLVVHNGGIINEVYIKKAGNLARGKLGERLDINEDYFRISISHMKSFIGRCEIVARKGLDEK